MKGQQWLDCESLLTEHECNGKGFLETVLKSTNSTGNTSQAKIYSTPSEDQLNTAKTRPVIYKIIPHQATNGNFPPSTVNA